MGRSYWIDIAALPETYDWARSADILDLSRAIASAAEYSSVYVASGGSFTTAVLGAQLHTEVSGKLSRAMTPLEALSLHHWAELSAVVVSAGGGNPDILGIFDHLVVAEPATLSVICSRSNSKLARKTKRYSHVELTEAEPPLGKDCFLATNSLLSTAVLLYRAYCDVFGSVNELPTRYDDLVPTPIRATQSESSSALSRPNLLVLYGPWSTAAAVDVESKISEAGLGSVQLCDYRSFAHGRHTGLNQNAESSAILSLFSQDDETLATSTLRLIPKKIPRLTIPLPFSGPVAAISGIAAVLHLIGDRAKQFGVDPGRPHVPQFGRKLYHLNIRRAERTRLNRIQAALTRKACLPLCTANDTRTTWEACGKSALRTLSEVVFDGVVLDYDGTLCDPQFRFSPLPENVAAEIERLLREGAVVGIATGRGKSVRHALRQSIDSRWWHKLRVGYYNASQIGAIDDEAVPDGTDQIVPQLASALSRLEGHPDLKVSAVLERRGAQITVMPRVAGNAGRVRALAVDLLAPELTKGVSVVHSSHSIDVLAPDVSKLALLDHLEKTAGRPLTLLRIGDLGKWPGNDFELLASPWGLSCYKSSASPNECWNFSKVGDRFSEAALAYLRSFRRRKKLGQFKLGLSART